MNPVYLDYNATTPVDPEVADAMIPILRNTFGNPSSAHTFGRDSRLAIEQAREKVAGMLHASPHEIIFTSGGTESNNLAVRGIAYSRRSEGNHIITSSVEHPAILEVCRDLEKDGFRVTYLDVDSTGMVSPARLESEITGSTILVTIMHANNEVGTIQPIREIAEILNKRKIAFHTDAAQSIGKIPVDVRELGVDLLSVAGHKFYGPKGVGALYIREGVRLTRLMHGANHEQNLRPGTENILEIVGLGKAAELVSRSLDQDARSMKETRDLLMKKIQEGLPWSRVNGHAELRLPNTLSMSFPGIDISLLLSALEKVAASAGAACHTDEITYSHVLMAMGVDKEAALGTIRLSTGRKTSRDEVLFAAGEIVQKVGELSGNRKEDIHKPEGEIKLTAFTHGLGCACKISPRILEEVLKNFPAASHPDILVGAETSDDAAVYRISSDTAIVQSVDFFTPVVDDPFQFGAIAAANALSDIYAMGARPLFGLNIVGFPHLRLPVEVLTRILEGAREVCDEAGVHILGGHTIEDNEPKFGMVITGITHPDKILRNKGARPGDKLILTKALGTGILSTALKKSLITGEITGQLFRNMRSLNKDASLAAREFNISACTDITGFGLLGHLKEVCEASGTGARIHFNSIKLLPEVKNLAARGIIPGGTENNFSFVSEHVAWDREITDYQKYILCDAQTSGGLLFSVNSKEAGPFLERLAKLQITASEIGEVLPENRPLITILP